MVSVTEFSKRVKEKYPEYKDVDDFELAKRIVEKYPEYAGKVNLKKKETGVAPSEKTPEIAPMPSAAVTTPSAAPSPSESQLPSAVPVVPIDPIDEDVPGINPDALAEVRNWFKDQNGAGFYYGESSPNRKAKFDEYVGLI